MRSDTLFSQRRDNTSLPGNNLALKSSAPPKPQDSRADAIADRPANELFTYRVIRLLDLVRRGATIANRRELGLSGIESRIMMQLGEHAPVSLNELAELVRLDPGQLSRTIKALVSRGLIDRKRRPGGPSLVLTMSSKGEEIHARIVALSRKRNEFLLADIPAEEVERAIRVLAAVNLKAEILLERERAIGAPADDEG